MKIFSRLVLFLPSFSKPLLVVQLKNKAIYKLKIIRKVYINKVDSKQVIDVYITSSTA